MKRFGFSALLVAAVSFSFGCRPGGARSASDADSQAIINAGHAWPGGSVEVCFINEPKTKGLKDQVQLALMTNFQKSNVGLEFTGFKSCDAAPQAPARAYFIPDTDETTNPSSKYIGTTKVFSRSLYDKYGATITLVDSQSFIAYNVALHEFGHFAGLFHEQSRLENINGRLCSKQEKGDFHEIAVDIPGSVPRQLGEFDRMSIMNYCAPGFYTGPMKLSDGDVQALRTLYKAYLPATGPSKTGVNPAELCNIIQLAKPYYTDRPTAPAYSDETMAKIVGEIEVGTKMSRLLTKPINTVVGKDQENLTAVLVIPSSGKLSGQKVWILGNLTQVVGCREVK